MKKFLLLPVAIVLVSCYNQEKKCQDFRTGTFVFEQEIEGVKHTSTFIRKENIEIETYNGKTDTASIRWVNDCEYVLQKLHPKNRAEQKGVSMRILTTKDNEYTFEYGIVGDVNKQKGTIKKID
ncbi:DNA topoisomerase IV [Myroides ceti]|uniref:DNA topoisomerase IV n=1 Tax=Paenimyroides ceti TaxID=395087 RepID=A0ABT8CTV2_9FLAO|nr:DNA topoisomerase IV [Paenimyroides ceti]MDN3707063.1 DNA topoisomerase IV [Paenimyroides ceti]